LPQLYGQWELLEKAAWMRALLHSLSAVPSKDLDKRVTREVSHVSRGWLKDLAEPKVENKLVTREVSHVARGWLKALAEPKVENKVVTREVSHVARGWLKALA